jgi:hypothetical protein
MHCIEEIPKAHSLYSLFGFISRPVTIPAIKKNP